MTSRFNCEIHHRRSIRLKGHDYSWVGAYFVTVCARDRECLLGEVIDGAMRVNEYGRIVEDCWRWLSEQYPYIDLDAWVVMPNHLHGILVMTDSVCRGGSRTAPTGSVRRKPLGRLIGAFKTVSTKRINLIRKTPAVPIWQRNYYEHIIRDEGELMRIRDYIVCNPVHWLEDENHPDCISSSAWAGKPKYNRSVEIHELGEL